MKRKYDLQQRLVKFAGDTILLCKTIQNDYAGKHLAQQIIRSSTSPALNYAESQAAESKRDFVHKNKIAVKELKETRANLEILQYIKYGDDDKISLIYKECNELIAIISTIIKKVNA